jgi:tetratricopeptide (TPR) repeat protein
MNAGQLFEEGKFKVIIKKLKTSQEPKDVELVAECYQKLKEWEEAMNCWNSLIQRFPDNSHYYNYRGVCKFNLRFKHAIQDFNKAIELDPANAYHYSCRAYIKDKTGDTEGAIEDYSTALELDPEDAITLNNLGLAEQKLGYTQRARERFKYSDDLLGIKSLDSREDVKAIENTSPNTKSTIWRELKLMLTSKEGFKQFLKDAGWKK